VEAYEIDILSDDETTVKRTLTSSAETVTYTNAHQVIDFGASKNFNLHFNVYQMSSAVGRGYPGHAIIQPSGVAEFGELSIIFSDGSLAIFEDGDEAQVEH
jgi:hypothetical protein